MTDERTFEELQKELQDVVQRLERGDVPVDDAIALFSAARSSTAPASNGSGRPSSRSRS